MHKVRFKSSVLWLGRAGIVNAGTFRVMAEPDPLVGLLLYILTVGDFSMYSTLDAMYMDVVACFCTF
jgi:hypothetical protein